MTGPLSLADSGDPIVYTGTRPASWPAPEGTMVTVTARRGHDPLNRASLGAAVGITWQRSDVDRFTTVALTGAEFDGIARALGYRPSGGNGVA